MKGMSDSMLVVGLSNTRHREPPNDTKALGVLISLQLLVCI